MPFDGTYVNGVPVPTIGSTGWGDELDAWLTSIGGVLVNVTDAPYGATGDSVSDDTAELQAALDATAPGGITLVPDGFYNFTHLTIADGKRLKGIGWQCDRDTVTTFGDAAYQTDANFSGAVLRCTATSGVAVTLVGSVTMQGPLENVCIIGPGSGTTVGIKMGTASIAVVNPVWRNVMVANFATGVQLLNVNDGQFDSLIVRGCTTGLDMSVSVNNNVFNMLDIQRCVTGMTDDPTCIANLFNAPIFQSNTGVSVTLWGVNETLQTPYFENVAGTRAIEVADGQMNCIISPRLAAGTDDIRVSSATATMILNPSTGTVGCIIDVTAGADATWIIGDLTTGITLTDAGVTTMYVDTKGNQARLPSVLIQAEAATPAAPGVNEAAWFTRDNGAGKTQVCVRFNTGAVQVLATQP